MNVGDVAIWTSLVVAVSASAVSIATVVYGRDDLRRWSSWLAWGTLLSLIATYGILTALFLSNDVSYLYVWSRSSSDLDAVYKLASAYSGAGGSTLLTAILMSLMSAVFLLRNRDSDQRLNDRFTLVSSLMVLGFVMTVALSDLFVATVGGPSEEWRTVAFPDGMGLNLSLQTWEMVVHPLFIFAGYAACLVLFSSAAAQLLAGGKGWVERTMPYARFAWLMITAGIAVGAWWSYYEVGWGGYWGWDPVETASLILWVTITAYIHAVDSRAKDPIVDRLVPMLGMAAFVSVLFSIFVTRSGRIWTFAVHTYSASDTGDAGSRLVSVLEGDPAVLAIFLLMLASLTAAIILAFRSRKAGAISDAPGTVVAPVPVITAGAFIAAIATHLLLLLKNTDASITSNYEEMTQKVPILFAVIVSILIVCMAWWRMDRKRALMLAIAILSSMTIAGLAGLYFDEDPFAMMTMPIFAGGMAISVAGLVKMVMRRSRSLKVYGSMLVHLGVTMVLLAFIVTTSFQISPSAGPRTSLNIGESIEVGGFSITVVDLEKTDRAATPSGNYNQVWRVVLDVSRDGRTVDEGVEISNFYLVNGTSELRKVKGQVLVIKTLSQDLYLEFDVDAIKDLALSSKTVPLMNLLWAGAGLLCAGIVVRCYAGRVPG